MGNTSSNANTRTGRSQEPKRTDKPSHLRSRSPTPAQDDLQSPKSKKKILELPDLANLTLTPASQENRGRTISPPKTASIPIPRATNPSLIPVRAALNEYTSTDLLPDYFLSQQAEAAGAVQGLDLHYGYTPDQSHTQRSKPSQHSQPPSQPVYHGGPAKLPFTGPIPTPFIKEIVHSSIPSGLESPAPLPEAEIIPTISAVADPLPNEPLEIRIIWRGGGSNVVLARAGDEEWNGRQPMERQGSSNTWIATVNLLPGTHHFRFLVDGNWRVAEELPTAVDDQGSLANYISVTHNPPPSPTSRSASSYQPKSTPPPGQSFWNPKPSADNAEEDDEEKEYNPPGDNSYIVAQAVQAKWTSVVPPELIEASKEEEVYLRASRGEYDAAMRGVRVTGFVPAPHVPPAPGMPRHLDKLILNTKVTVPSGASASGSTAGGSNSGSPARGSGSERTGMASGIGSGQGGSSRERERERKRDRDGRESRRRREERERERAERREKRERERRERGWNGDYPPAPPPSEDGTGTGLEEKLAESSTQPATKTAEMSANLVPDTTIKAAVDTQALPTPSAAPSQSLPTASSGAPTSSLHPVSSSRAITLDMDNMPAITDDSSVLPVPSHVVLQHLCTSAIRKGVMAVATTTRYRKKYLTTMYYKPS